MGNCGESAQLAAIIAKVNGIKNCFLASLEKANGKDLDHTVVYVDGEKPYIIDAWLGFADYEENVFTKYKSEYAHHFDIEDGDKLRFSELITDYTDSLNQEFSRSQLNKLKKIYPSHVIRRGYV